MRVVLRLLFGVAFCAIVARPALAAEDSVWAEDAQSRLRLIAGKATATHLRAGVEIDLKPGWKTYWRYPGDAGVPPRFDFSRSENVADARILWPAPHAFTDEGGTSIGYKGGVIFPVHVTPKDRRKPVLLKLDIDYAVCEKLCVPAQATATLQLGSGSTAHERDLAEAEAAVPEKLAANDAKVTAQRLAGASRAAVILDLAAPAGAAVEVFAEGPTAEWSLPIPKPVDGAAIGHRRFQFDLDGLPAKANPAASVDLTVTIVGGTRAVETRVRLD